MSLLNWVGDHPVISIVAGIFITASIADTLADKAISRAMALNHTCSCQCDKPADGGSSQCIPTADPIVIDGEEFPGVCREVRR